MSTETGGSSTATGIGNLEMSTISIGSTQQFSTGGMINVPDHLRRVDERAFTPQLISIGPIHCYNIKLQTMKQCKLQFYQRFIRRANINLENLQETIRGMEARIRSYYAETILSSISHDDFVTMILVDGMFILEYLMIESNPHLIGYDPMPGLLAEWMSPILKSDLVLLENQLPFFVLEILFEYANLGAELQLKPLSLKELAFEFFQCYNFGMKYISPYLPNLQHFTDLVRLFYLSDELSARILGGAKLPYSATQLHETGVKFEGFEFDANVIRYRWHRDFIDIRFNVNNAVLEIPCFMLNDERVRLIRNVIALEQSLYVGHAYVTDFFVFLNFLIKTSKDVDLLCDKGILVNNLRDSEAAALAINSLSPNTSVDYINSTYFRICKELDVFYKQPWQRWRAAWYRWREILWLQYFSTPWRAASTCGAIILLVLTAIQTVCSLKSTKW